MSSLQAHRTRGFWDISKELLGHLDQEVVSESLQPLGVYHNAGDRLGIGLEFSFLRAPSVQFDVPEKRGSR
jgi:hypothetical protein